MYKRQDLFEEWIESSISHIPNFGCEYKIFEHISPKEKIFFSKTGYTGENGLEILLSKKAAINLWDFSISKNVAPCGLGARDTLRLEAGMHLYGQDINEETSPYEAGLGWLVHLENNHEFFGKRFLEEQSRLGIQKKLVGLSIDGKAIGRKGCAVLKFVFMESLGLSLIIPLTIITVSFLRVSACLNRSAPSSGLIVICRNPLWSLKSIKITPP